jgi:hypothetical protein
LEVDPYLSPLFLENRLYGVLVKPYGERRAKEERLRELKERYAVSR